MPAITRAATWIATRELFFLALASPLLLFPNRWTPLAFALILLTWLCRRITFGRLTISTAMDAPLAILVLMALVGFYVSADPAMSQAKFWGIVLQVAVFYGIVNGLRTEKGITQMAGLLVVTTTGVALLSLVGTDWDAVRLLDLPQVYGRLPRLNLGLPGSGVPRPSDLFYPREVGATMAFLLPLCLALLLYARNRWLRALSALALVVGGVTLLLSQSLQGLAGFGMALLLVAAWRSRWFLLGIPLGLLALAAGLLAYGPGRAALAALSLDHPLGIGVVLRIDIWSRALAMVQDMPFTGVGLNTYPLILSHFYPGFLLGPEVHAHSLFLQTAVDLGLLGLLAFVWLLVAFYLTLVRAYRLTPTRDLRALLVGLAAGVLAYVGHGLVDTVTLGAKPVVALFAMLGLAAAVLAVEKAQDGGRALREELPQTVFRRNRITSVLQRALPVVLLLVLLVSVAVLAPATPHLNLGAIRAHKALVAVRTTGSDRGDGRSRELGAAIDPLRQALARDPGNVYVYDKLGSLYAWQGDYAASLEAFERKVALDLQAPMARYAPFEAFRRSIQGVTGHDPCDDALWVYRHWQNRYPDRAEGYVRSALVWHQCKGDSARAAHLLQSGLENGAEPQGLLSHTLAQLQ